MHHCTQKYMYTMYQKEMLLKQELPVSTLAIERTIQMQIV